METATQTQVEEIPVSITVPENATQKTSSTTAAGKTSPKKTPKAPEILYLEPSQFVFDSAIQSRAVEPLIEDNEVFKSLVYRYESKKAPVRIDSPVLVFLGSSGGTYRLITGHQRVKAASEWNARHPEAAIKVPAIVNLKVSDIQALILNIQENFSRNNLTPVDIAYQISLLESRAKLSRTAIAKLYNQKPAWVTLVAKINSFTQEQKLRIQSGETSWDAEAKLAKYLADIKASEPKPETPAQAQALETKLNQAASEILSEVTAQDGKVTARGIQDILNQKSPPAIPTVISGENSPAVDPSVGTRLEVGSSTAPTVIAQVAPRGLGLGLPGSSFSVNAKQQSSLANTPASVQVGPSAEVSSESTPNKGASIRAKTVQQFIKFAESEIRDTISRDLPLINFWVTAIDWFAGKVSDEAFSKKLDTVYLADSGTGKPLIYPKVKP